MEPDYLGIESCYDKIEYQPELSEVKPWDFSRYTPDVVIFAFGQNDNHPDDYMAEDYNSARSENWRQHYRRFRASYGSISEGNLYIDNHNIGT